MVKCVAEIQESNHSMNPMPWSFGEIPDGKRMIRFSDEYNHLIQIKCPQFDRVCPQWILVDYSFSGEPVLEEQFSLA